MTLQALEAAWRNVAMTDSEEEECTAPKNRGTGKKCSYVGADRRCRWCNAWAPKCTEVDERGKVVHHFNTALPGERSKRCTKCGRKAAESGFKRRKQESDGAKRRKLKARPAGDKLDARRRVENATCYKNRKAKAAGDIS